MSRPPFSPALEILAGGAALGRAGPGAPPPPPPGPRGSGPSARAAVPEGAGAGPGWPTALLALGLGLALLGRLFAEEAAAAVRVWDESSAYNHCWLILPLALWLAWQRRDRLRGLRPAPSPALALLALPAGLAWLAAERLGIMEGRQFAALALAEILLLAVLGGRIGRAMAAPLAYLAFLVPFGAFATPLLQRITARLVEFGLGLTGIPHFVDDLVIEIPAGTFLVAEACAGLRFLIAALAFGALYALVMFRSPGRRLAVMALALAVPILANGLRAFGIVLLGHYLGSAEAAVADHVLYGWVFFSLVLLLLILAGLPFREDGAPRREEAARHGTARPWTGGGAAALVSAAALAVGLAATGPAVAGRLDRAGGQAPARVAFPLLPMPGCTAAEAEGALRCPPGALVTAGLLRFPAAVTWRAVGAARGRLAGADDQDRVFRLAMPGGADWEVRASAEGATATALWLNGQPAGSGLPSRLRQAWNSLGGGEGVPVLAAVTLRPVGGPEEEHAWAMAGMARQRELVEAVLRMQGPAIAARGAALSSR